MSTPTTLAEPRMSTFSRRSRSFALCVTALLAACGGGAPPPAATVGLVQPVRGAVTLTREGRRIAHHLVHRHEDMVRFLELVLGLESEQAELDACQLEHGLSALTAQRLHHFLEHLERLPEVQRERLLAFKGRDLDEAPDFETIPDSKQIGWRG